MTKSLLNLIALIVFTQTKILDHFEEYQRENSDYRDQYLFRQYLALKKLQRKPNTVSCGNKLVTVFAK
jgi:hypothetical protein